MSQLAEAVSSSSKEYIDYSVTGFAFKGDSASQAQRRLMDLLKAEENRQHNNATWDIRKQYLAVAKQLFGPYIYDWVKINIDIEVVVGRRLDFILDTINFVNGKNRSITTTSWYELMDMYPDHNRVKSAEAKEKSNTLLEVTPKVTTVEFLARWCSQPKGYEDLVATLEICFGPERTTDKAERKISGAMPVNLKFD